MSEDVSADHPIEADVLPTLRRIAPFLHLEDSAATALAKKVIRRTYRRGAVLPDVAKGHGVLCLLTRGSLRLCRVVPSGDEITLAILRTPASFLALPDDHIVVQYANTELYHVSWTDLMPLMAVHQQLSHMVCSIFEHQLAQSYARLEDLTAGSTVQRLARLLARLAAADTRQRVLLSHQELAYRIRNWPIASGFGQNK